MFLAILWFLAIFRGTTALVVPRDSEASVYMYLVSQVVPTLLPSIHFVARNLRSATLSYTTCVSQWHPSKGEVSQLLQLAKGGQLLN